MSSQDTIGGKTGEAHIIQGAGISFRPRPYLNFVGATVTDANGKTNVTVDAPDLSGYATIAYVDAGTWLMPPIIEWYDPTDGLPVDPAVGDRYGADATAHGWTIDYIYEWDGEAWIESAPEEGWMLWDLFGLIMWVFFSGGWMEMGSDSFLNLDETNWTADSPLAFDTDTKHLSVDLSSKQDADATLTALAALDATAGFVKQTGADTFTKDTTTYVATNASATRSIILTAEGATSNASSGVTFGTLATADSQNYNYCVFNASGISYASWSFVMPDNYDGGTITAKIYWFHPATTTNFGVMWGVQARAVGNGEALTGAWTSSLQEVADTGGTTSYLYISDATPAITISNTPVGGKLVHLFVRRDPTDGADTMSVDAYLLRVKLEYGINAYTE